MKQELRKITMNIVLAAKIAKEENERKRAESAEYQRNLRIEWKQETVEDSQDTVVEETISDVLYQIISEYANEHVRARNSKIAAKLAHEKCDQILDNFVQNTMKQMVRDEIEEMHSEHARHVSDMRARRQVRLVKQAAIWWLRQTRSAVRRRRARRVMPKLASENLLAKLGKNSTYRPLKRRSAEALSVTQDELTKSWKHKRQMQLNRRQISPFNTSTFIDKLFEGKTHNPNYLIASIFIQYPPGLSEFARKKFGVQTLIRRFV